MLRAKLREQPPELEPLVRLGRHQQPLPAQVRDQLLCDVPRQGAPFAELLKGERTREEQLQRVEELGEERGLGPGEAMRSHHAGIALGEERVAAEDELPRRTHRWGNLASTSAYVPRREDLRNGLRAGRSRSGAAPRSGVRR